MQRSVRLSTSLALALYCASCASPPRGDHAPMRPTRAERLPAAPPARPAPPSMPPVSAALGARAQAALAEARLRMAEAQARNPGWRDPDGLLQLTGIAASHGDDALTLHYARLAIRSADRALNGYYDGLARTELDRIYAHTGLSNLQLARVQYIESALVRGDARTAYELAAGLREELEIAARAYRVKSGETLWQISAKDEVYGNGQLWPLIFDANRETMRSPTDLSADKLLKIRANPTIEEVVRAIDYARTHTPGEVYIGEIKIVEPESR